MTIAILGLLYISNNGRYFILKQNGKHSVYTTRVFPYLAKEGDMYLDRRENSIFIYYEGTWTPLIVGGSN